MAAVDAGAKDSPAAQQSDDNEEDEEQVEEIAPFDERIRLFANAPRSPPAMSASFLAPTYSPLSLDTVRAHVLPTDSIQLPPLYPCSLHQSPYSAPVHPHHHHHHQHHPTSSPASGGGMHVSSNFATPATLSLMLPPAAPTGPRSTSGPAMTSGGGYITHMPNNLIHFATSPSLQIQQAVSMPSSQHHGNPSLGFALEPSSSPAMGQN